MMVPSGIVMVALGYDCSGYDSSGYGFSIIPMGAQTVGWHQL